MEFVLTQELCNEASEYAKKEMFKKNSPIVIIENGKLFHLFKNGDKKIIRG